MPLVPVLGRQMDLCEFKAGLVYKASSRTVRANPVSKEKNLKAT